MERRRSRARSTSQQRSISPPPKDRSRSVSPRHRTPTRRDSSPDNKMNQVIKILAEVAHNQDLSKNSQSSLDELHRKTNVGTYRERAHFAMLAAGTAPPDVQQHTKAPALCNPTPTPDPKGVCFPLGNMIISRMLDSWRAVAGLKGEDAWNPYWDCPPPNPSKVNKMVPKPQINQSDYKFPQNDFVSAKALKIETAVSEKSTNISVATSRLEEWEQTVASCLGIVNMLDVFSSSLLKDLQTTWTVLESFTPNSLPVELANILEEKHRITTDAESKAKGLQHLTSHLAWLLTDTVTLRRDHYLAQSNLSGPTKEVLRLQPLGGPYLFNGRAEEMKEKDSKNKTASLVLNMSERFFVKKDQGTSQSTKNRSSPKPSSSRFPNRWQGNQSERNQSFRSYSYRKERKPFRKYDNNRKSFPAKKGGKPDTEKK